MRSPMAQADPKNLTKQPNMRVELFNAEAWNRLACAGHRYTRPEYALPKTARGVRRRLDPRGHLAGLRLAGASVLVLAGGGGLHGVMFAKLGANTTVLDISNRQIATVRRLARRHRVSVRCMQGDMGDLSRFPPASFDVVWHLHSLVYVPNAGRVFREVGRVLAPGGLYRMTTMHPTTLRLFNSYDGRGWHPVISYFSNRAIRDEWRKNGKLFATTLEYGHRIETIVNGIVAHGMLVDGLWEFSPKEHPYGAANPDGPLEAVFPTYLEVRARKRGA